MNREDASIAIIICLFLSLSLIGVLIEGQKGLVFSLAGLVLSIMTVISWR